MKIVATDRNGLLADVMDTLSSNNINISSLNVKTNNNFEAIMKIKIMVLNTLELDKIIANLRKVSSIIEIRREGL